MFRSRLLTGLSAVALVASGVAFSAPASAIPYQVTIVKQRTGATPIVAGANGGTEFTITVTNTYTEPVEVPLSDVPGAGLVVTGVTSATWSNCTVEDYLVSCPPAELQPNQPATLVVSAKAEWWVRPSSLVNCAYASQFFVPQASAAVDPAGASQCALVAPEVGTSNGEWYARHSST